MVKKSLLIILALAMGLGMLATTAAAVGRQFVEVGLGYRWFDYEEELESPLKSNETGRLPSARFAYNYQGVDNPIYAEISFRYTGQSTDYDGTYQDGTPVKDSTDNTWWQFEFLAGYIIRNFLNTPVRLIPYSGIGYRLWERNLNGPSPYREDYSWFYLPVGVRLDVPVTTDFTFGLDASMNIMFGGQMQIDWTYNPALQSGDLSLGNRIGYKFQVPMNYQFTPAFSLSLNPWYEYIRIGSSDWQEVYTSSTDEEGNVTQTIQGRVKEPSSDTHEFGVDVGVRFWF